MVMTATQSGQRGTLEVTASAGLTGFASTPTLTAGKNAVLHVGDPASPTPVTRPDNTISDLVPGVTIDLLKAAPGTDLTVTVKKDDDAVVAKIKGLVESLNGVLSWVHDNSKYDVASKTGGPMVGDAGVRSLPGPDLLRRVDRAGRTAPTGWAATSAWPPPARATWRSTRRSSSRRSPPTPTPCRR